MTPPLPVKNRATIALVALTASLFVTSGAFAAGDPVLNIHTSSAGVYRVGYEDLASATAVLGPWPTSTLGLTNRGSAVPIWIEDGGDGLFGEGDAFEFVAGVLPGSHGALHEYSPTNVYLLSLNERNPRRMTAAQGSRLGSPSERATADYSGSVHLEVDTLLMRFGCGKEAEHELWYWQKLASVDPSPFRYEFETPGLDATRGTARLKIDLHGWSALYRRPESVTDHSLLVYLNDVKIHEEAWNGKTTHSITLEDLDPGLFRAGGNTIGLHVPDRRDEQGGLIADAVVLNWIRIDYPRSSRIDPDRQAAYRLPPGARRGSAVLESTGPAVVYAADGTRIQLPPSDKSGVWLEFPGRRSFRVAPPGTLLKPHRIAPFAGRRLASLARQADYITIVHGRLREAIEPLMQYRRAQGLTVEVALLDEVYDAFNDGIPHPGAIKKFLREAHETWPKPAPRFVLLVGDASWDSKHDVPKPENYAFKTGPLQNDGVGRPEGTGYENLTANDRGLIPTYNYLTHSGHAASDNWFVAFGDEAAPRMAIGRLPVVSPAEVTEIVGKTLAHERAAADEWRTNTLWITNEQPFFQDYSDRLASTFVDRGYVANKIYPVSGEEGNSQRIVDALDDGQYLVYFYGHGGRFIWRTSPQDLSRNRDLFSLADLDRLSPTVKTPIVMSFTCYSAPFDHPSEDSIGEKLVRIGGRGAVAVIAASWRNAPSLATQQSFLDAIAESATVGEAMVAAKSRIRTEVVIATYNLLGDPALRLKNAVRLEARSDLAETQP